MGIIGETNKSHIVRDGKATLTDSIESCEGNDIIECQDGIRAVGALQQGNSIAQRNIVVNIIADNHLTNNGKVVFAKRLQIAMLPAAHHIKVVRSTDKSNTSASCVYEMLSGLLRSLIAISRNRRNVVRETGTTKENQGNAHFVDFFEVTIVGGALGKTCDDSYDMKINKIVDSHALRLTTLMGIGTDDAIARSFSFFLYAIKYRSIIVGNEIWHDNANYLRSLLA